MDIDKLMNILEQIEKMGVAGKKVMADGKVDLADMAVAIGLLSNVGGMIDAFKSAGEAFEEAKDLNAEEGLAIAAKLYEIGKKIEQA